jgi:hypothetical protein
VKVKSKSTGRNANTIGCGKDCHGTLRYVSSICTRCDIHTVLSTDVVY